MGVFTKRLMWDPTIEGRNIKHTFDKFSGKFGERMAIYCNVAKRYSKLMVAILHDINEGKLSPDEGADRYKEVLDKEQTDKVKKRAVGVYKAAETRRRNAEIKLIPKVGSAAERDREAMLESNSIQPTPIKEVLNNIDPYAACMSRFKNTTQIDNNLMGGNNNIMSALKSPLMVLLYLMKHRPFISKDRTIKNIEYDEMYTKGQIAVNKTTADISDDLEIPYSTAHAWLVKLEEERIIFKHKVGRNKYIIIGYIKEDKEIYFYNLPPNERLLRE